MRTELLEKYAALLVNYCLEIKEGDKVFIQTTTLAEPLLREVYRAAIAAGAHNVEYDMIFRGRNNIFMRSASDAQLDTVSPFYEKAMRDFDAYLFIRAPFNLREEAHTEGGRSKRRSAALSAVSKVYAERTACRDLRRNLCQYPTDAAAQEAGMSLEDYTDFVANACRLTAADPRAAWLDVRKQQQAVVDYLNNCNTVRYVGGKTDITFSTEGRRWINSDGQTNMPSGEVYTSPVENAVNGVVHFSLPCLYQGNEVRDVTLWVKDGYVEKWEATEGKAFLDYIFSLDGARRFGEAAIGTNYNIKQLTKNILFDEKIGGTVHMAIGQSYLQAGGKNESAVHWDMITDMTKGGEIYADGTLIYQNGQFVDWLLV